VEHYEIAGAQAVFPSQRRQRCDHCQNLEGPALLSPSMACPCEEDAPLQSRCHG
jgi:hypothetical protein